MTRLEAVIHHCNTKKPTRPSTDCTLPSNMHFMALRLSLHQFQHADAINLAHYQKLMANDTSSIPLL
jgi:hypothetical protein